MPFLMVAWFRTVSPWGIEAHDKHKPRGRSPTHWREEKRWSRRLEPWYFFPTSAPRALFKHTIALVLFACSSQEHTGSMKWSIVTLFLGIEMGEIKGGSLILKLLLTQQTKLLVSGRKGSWRREQPGIFYTEEWNQKWEKRYNQNPPPFYFNSACTS